MEKLDESWWPYENSSNVYTEAEQVSDHSGIAHVLILGHSGFIGRHLSATITTTYPGMAVTGRSMSDFDLTNPAAVVQLSDEIDPDTVVVVCAAIKKQLGDTIAAFEHNIAIITNLCRFFQSHPVARVVYFSSAAVYGEDVHNLAITEESPIRPRSYYGLAKFTSECLLEKAFEQRHIRSLLTLRPPLVFGPGDASESYGPVGFVLKAMRGDPIVLWGDGDEKRCFIFIEDLARIVSRLAIGPYEGKVNIASNEGHSFREILAHVTEMLPGKLSTSTRERTKAKVDNAFDNSRLIDMIGAFSFTPLSVGISKTIAALKDTNR